MGKLIHVAAMALAAVLLLGNSQCQSNTSSSSTAPDFVTTMTVEDANGNPATNFSQGQNIQFVLTVRNRSSTDQTVYMYPCVNEYEFVVLMGNTSNIATSLVGPNPNIGPVCMIASAYPMAMVLHAGATYTYSYPWDQTDSTGQLIPPGNYEVMGGLICYTSDNQQAQPDTVDCLSLSANNAQLSPALFRSTLIQFTIQQ